MCKNLLLHLPAELDSKNNQFVGGYGTDGGTCNYWHSRFSDIMGQSSLQSLFKVLRDPACEHQVHPGFLARNIPVGQVQVLVAFTWGRTMPPAGGTLHTWSHSQAQKKIHVSLVDL